MPSASTTSVIGTPGTNRRPSTSSAIDTAPTASVVPCTSPSSPSTSANAGKKLPSPAGTPSTAGSCASVITMPRPNRKPVITGLDTRSATAPKRSQPPNASTTPTTSASAADSAAKRAVSPPASSPTVAADTADVAVVALTTSWCEVPSSA